MKIVIKIWSITLLLFAMSSCSSAQKSTSNDNDKNTDFIVSFFSKGIGIDRKIYPEFKNFLTTNYPNLDYSESKHGREGERFFCFDLSSLKKNKKNDFIQQAKVILSKSELVRLQENSPCLHKE
jgi:hypothetical protein